MPLHLRFLKAVAWRAQEKEKAGGRQSSAVATVAKAALAAAVVAAGAVLAKNHLGAPALWPRKSGMLVHLLHASTLCNMLLRLSRTAPGCLARSVWQVETLLSPSYRGLVVQY